MAGEDEGDPEGRLLTELRETLGRLPLVASLDLHAVLSDGMVRAADALVPFHTYPHIDHTKQGNVPRGSSSNCSMIRPNQP